MLGGFKAVASNLQKKFNDLITELVRLQKVEQEAKELKNTVDSLQKSCDDLKMKIALTAAKSDAQAKAQHTDSLSNTAVITDVPILAINSRRDRSEFISWCVKIQPTISAISWLEVADQVEYVSESIHHTCATRKGSYATCNENCYYYEISQRLVTEDAIVSVKEMLQYVGRQVYGLSQVL